jgi:Berberine and berberine like
VYGFMGKVALPAHPDTHVNSIGLTPIFNGDPREGMDLIAPILKFPNIFIDLYNMTLPDFEIFNGLLTNVGGKQAYIRSGFMPPKAFTPPAISTLTDAMASAPSPDSLLVWTHMGGKIEDVGPQDTAFWHRKARFLWEVKSIWSSDDQFLQNVDWGYALGEAMKPHDQGAYVNYIDPLLTNWKKEYYGENSDRLAQIKKEWDPSNRFTFQQAVDCPFEPTPGNFAPLFRTFIA